VCNRVHDLADIVMDINIKQGRRFCLTLSPDVISVTERGERTFSAPLPPAAMPQRVLDGLEEMLEDVRAHQNRGANQ
ncbi:hypothetical protein, partial [Halomonas sp. MES3-P3E]|uniref:hypothetical protein n=1 Tax=Halomonas sp. MES3-P3E TaxID=2058321 RepID=UPI0012FF133A